MGQKTARDRLAPGKLLDSRYARGNRATQWCFFVDRVALSGLLKVLNK